MLAPVPAFFSTYVHGWHGNISAHGRMCGGCFALRMSELNITTSETLMRGCFCMRVRAQVSANMRLSLRLAMCAGGHIAYCVCVCV